MVIYSYSCPFCGGSFDTTNENIKIKICYKCKEKIIKGNEIYKFSDVNDCININANEIFLLERKLETIEKEIEQYETIKSKLRKALISLGLLNAPCNLEKRRLRNDIKDNIEKLKSKNNLLSCIIRQKVPEAQQRYLKDNAIKKQLAEARASQITEEYNRILSENIYDRNEFIIREKDYKRGNVLDNYIRNNYKNSILDFFDSRCFICGTSENLTLDHLWLPKNEDGNFIMYHIKSQALINNLLVLCNSCNAAKSDRKFSEFFTLKQLDDLAHKNKILNTYYLEYKPIIEIAQKWYEKSVYKKIVM